MLDEKNVFMYVSSRLLKDHRTMASAGWQGAPYFRRYVCKGLSNDGVGGVARGTVLQEIRLQRAIKRWRRRGGKGHRTSGDTTGIIGAGFKTGDSVKE